MQHSVVLKNEERTLRPVSIDDAEFIVKLRNQSHVKGCVNDTSTDIDSQRKWIQDYLRRGNEYYWIIETPDGEPFGTASLYHYDAEKNQIESGRWVELKGEKYTYNLFKSTIQVNDFAFNCLKVSRIVFDVVATNKRVIRYHQSYGAEVTGVEKGAVVLGGVPNDVVWMQITREKWPEIRSFLERLS